MDGIDLGEALLEVSSHEARHFATLALVLCASGEESAANETVQHALKCNPDSATAKVLAEILIMPRKR